MGMQKDKSGYEVMTVAELIAALQTMPPTTFVYTEGCDCLGRANGVMKENDYVLITRSSWDGITVG